MKLQEPIIWIAKSNWSWLLHEWEEGSPGKRVLCYQLKARSKFSQVCNLRKHSFDVFHQSCAITGRVCTWSKEYTQNEGHLASFPGCCPAIYHLHYRKQGAGLGVWPEGTWNDPNQCGTSFLSVFMCSPKMGRLTKAQAAPTVIRGPAALVLESFWGGWGSKWMRWVWLQVNL